MVRKIILSVIMIPILFLTYYLVEQYHLSETSEKRVYTSFHDDEVQQMLKAFNKLDLKKTKRLSMSENYTKIRFMEDGLQYYIEYHLYDNGFIKYVEDGLAGGKNITYSMEEEKLNTILASLLMGKTLE